MEKIFFIILLIASFSLAQSKWQNKSPVGFLLPGDIVPSHYDVLWSFEDDCKETEMSFNFETSFTGRTRITMMAVKPNVTAIQLNGLMLKIITANLTVEGTSMELKLTEVHAVQQKIIFQSPKELPIFKSVVLDVVFEGSTGRDGIFIKIFKEGEVFRELIGTQFEPAQARRAFPGFDEPKYRASFKVAINVSTCLMNNGYRVLSNSPMENIENLGARSVIHFEKTNVNMPTYLLAFSVTPYESTPPKMFNSSFPDLSQTEWKEFRTWEPKNPNYGGGHLSQSAGPQLMELFSKILDIGYPLKKMDIIGVLPEYSGAMENWGLITYSMDITSKKIPFLNILSHEIAHQWFGNLATCHWWSDIWLNEGFSTYFASYVLSKIALDDPDLPLRNLPLRYELINIRNALLYDSLGLNSSLTEDVENPVDYPYRFSPVAYSKGGSVLRMWHNILGDSTFMKSIRLYLKDRIFNYTKPEHLLASFDNFAHESTSDFGDQLPSVYFRNWHLESAFPVIQVIKSQKKVYDVSQINYNGKSAKWTVPISYSTSNDLQFNKTHAMLWLTEQDDKVSIELEEPVFWIIVNNQYSGYYVVNYDQENWMRLVFILSDLNSYKTIHIANRIQIVSDLSLLVRKVDSNMDYSLLLKLLLYLKHEIESLPWELALEYEIRFLDVMLSKNEEYYPMFKEYVKDLLRSHYDRLTFNVKSGESGEEKRMRIMVMEWACKLGQQDCIQESIDFMKRHPIGTKSLDKLKEIAYCTIIREKEENNWDLLWDTYKSSNDSDEKRAIIRGIGCSNDSNILRRLLLKSVDKSVYIHPGDRSLFLRAVLKSNPRNVHLILNFLMEHYRLIEELYDAKHSPVSEILNMIADMVATDEELDKMRKLIDVIRRDKNIYLRPYTIAKTLNKVADNNKWIKHKSEQVIRWLALNYGADVNKSLCEQQ